MKAELLKVKAAATKGKVAAGQAVADASNNMGIPVKKAAKVADKGAALGAKTTRRAARKVNNINIKAAATGYATTRNADEVRNVVNKVRNAGGASSGSRSAIRAEAKGDKLGGKALDATQKAGVKTQIRAARTYTKPFNAKKQK